MPQEPIIIPLIIVGLLVGGLLKHPRKSISKKSLAVAAIFSGLLNGLNAYLLDILSPTPTTNFPTGGVGFQTGGTTTFTARAFALRATPIIPFTILSILVGILIVLLVVGIAVLYRRMSGAPEEEPVAEEKATDELLG